MLNQPLINFLQNNIYDFAYMFLCELAENDYAVDPVDKFWSEGPLKLLHQLFTHVSIGFLFLYRLVSLEGKA